MSPAREGLASNNAGSRRTKVARRLKTIPAVGGMFLLFTALLPILVPVAVAIDAVLWLIRRRAWMAVRITAFGWLYLLGQVVGQLWLLAGWIGSGFGWSPTRLIESAYRVQRVWAHFLLAAVRRLFGLRLEVENSAAASRSAIFMPRHASLIDTLLPSVLITAEHGIRLRYVLKKELLADPALDVAGSRLPNYFVDRRSRGSMEAARVAELANGIGPSEGVLIYPEGTRYRQERQAGMIRRLGRRPELQAIARNLNHVHPPRLGGPIALFDSGLDVVFVAHAGLDGFARVADVWAGEFVGSTVRVSFRRVLASEIPIEQNDRERWLFAQWAEVDAEVGRLLAENLS